MTQTTETSEPSGTRPRPQRPRGPAGPRPTTTAALLAAVRDAYGLPDDFQLSAAGTPGADASVADALWDHLEDPSLPRPWLPGDPPLRALSEEVRTSEGRRVAAGLGHRVQAWRTAQGLTQQALAERLGWDQPHVARLEGGGVVPTLATLQLLADRLGLVITVAPHTAPVLVPHPASTGE